MNNQLEILSLIGGKVSKEILLRNEYLAEENRILRSKIIGDIEFTEYEKRRLTNLATKIGVKALKGMSMLITPGILLKWAREKARSRKHRSRPRGRPHTPNTLVELIFKFKLENPNWGITRIQGALLNLGFKISIPTITTVLKKNGFPTKPTRTNDNWENFLKAHEQLIVACDFFHTRIYGKHGYENVTVLFFIRLDTRQVHIAGITYHPTTDWLKKIMHTECMESWGFLKNRKYLIHDNDVLFDSEFNKILKTANIQSKRISPYSPNLNAFAERFVLTVKNELLRNLFVFDISSLWNILDEFLEHYHFERNHQGKHNQLLFRDSKNFPKTGDISIKSRLGGLLNYYFRKVA